jgi:hypothetical protein
MASKKPARRAAKPRKAAKKSGRAAKSAEKKSAPEVHAPEIKRVTPQAPAHAPQPADPTVSTVVLPARKPGEQAPKPGAGGREFDDEDDLEEFDPLFDEVREERD